jgi:predicted Zn-dependent protease
MKDRASKLKGLIWFVAACFLGVFLATGIRPLAHVIPWSWEKKLGYAIGPVVGAEECRYSHEADALLQRLVQRLYPIGPEDAGFPIEVRVVKSPVINAYAALGGKITINSGLLNKAGSPEEVAGVLAHEIEHVHHRHIMEGAIIHLFTAEGIHFIFGTGSSTAGFAEYFLRMDFTRSQETQADEEGLRRLQNAHIDNRGFKRFFERMEKEDTALKFLSDHPSNRARMEMTDDFPNKDIQPIMTEAEWKVLKEYCKEK